MAGATATLTEADNGKRFELRAGDTIVVRLHENATSGYRWSFDGLDTSMIRAQEPEYVGRAGAVGSGGDVEWKLEATKPGTTQIELKLWRQWEGDASIQKRFAATLVVRA